MKTLTKILTLSLVVATSLSVTSSALSAQNIPQRGPISFETYDANNDGKISERELYDARAARMIQKADQGMPMRNAGKAPDFETIDTNGDGKISKVELLETQNRQMQNNRAGNKIQMQDTMKGMGRNIPTFKDFDLNNDGYLTEAEMDEFRANRMTKKASQGKMLRNSANKTNFSDIDTNNDGKVSQKEFMANRMKKRAQ